MYYYNSLPQVQLEHKINLLPKIACKEEIAINFIRSDESSDLPQKEAERNFSLYCILNFFLSAN